MTDATDQPLLERQKQMSVAEQMRAIAYGQIASMMTQFRCVETLAEGAALATAFERTVASVGRLDLLEWARTRPDYRLWTRARNLELVRASIAVNDERRTRELLKRLDALTLDERTELALAALKTNCIFAWRAIVDDGNDRVFVTNNDYAYLYALIEASFRCDIITAQHLHKTLVWVDRALGQICVPPIVCQVAGVCIHLQGATLDNGRYDLAKTFRVFVAELMNRVAEPVTFPALLAPAQTVPSNRAVDVQRPSPEISAGPMPRKRKPVVRFSPNQSGRKRNNQVSASSDSADDDISDSTAGDAVEVTSCTYNGELYDWSSKKHFGIDENYIKMVVDLFEIAHDANMPIAEISDTLHTEQTKRKIKGPKMWPQLASALAVVVFGEDVQGRKGTPRRRHFRIKQRQR